MATYQWGSSGDQTADVPDAVLAPIHEQYKAGTLDAEGARAALLDALRPANFSSLSSQDQASAQRDNPTLSALASAGTDSGARHEFFKAFLDNNLSSTSLIAKPSAPSSAVATPHTQNYSPAQKMIDLGNGQQVGYDTAMPDIRAAADAGRYKIVNTPATGTPPAQSTSVPAVSPQPEQTSSQNIYNPQTGQKGYQIPGAQPPPGWQFIPAGGVPGAQPSQTTPPASTTGQTTSATVGGAATPAATTPAIPTTVLQPGMNGDAVKQLQDFLVQAGFMTAAQVATGPGIYGPQTTAAVKALQDSLGVDSSSGPGYFGPKTIAALQKFASQQTPVTDPTANQTGTTSSTVGGSQDGTGGMGGNGAPGSYTEGNSSNLSSLLASVGISISPQTSLTDMVTQIANLYGITDIQDSMKSLDDKFANDVADINDDPWISEGIRQARVKKLQDKYDQKKQLYLDELKMKDDVVGKAVTLFQNEKTQEQALLLKVLDDKLTANNSTASTTDIKEYNLAVSQGYKGSFLEYEKQSANLKAVKPSTTIINTGASTDAETQLKGALGSDGYTDPNLYASVRARSTLTPTVFDDKFGYLVNPTSKQRLGITTVKAPGSGSIDFSQIPSM